MPKRKYSSTGRSTKRRRTTPFRRPRGRYGRSFKKRGSRFPTYKFHRYINSVTKYGATTGNNEVWTTSELPFTLYPGTGTSPVATTSWPIAWAFCFSDVGNLTEFTSLFDRYMITGVQMSFQLINNPNADDPRGANIGGGAADSLGVYPKLWYAIDHDDASVTTLAQLKEYGNVKCRVLKPNATIKIYVPYPRVSSLVSQTSGAQPAGVGKPQWLDCGYPNIEHYGLKTVIDTNGIASTSTNFPFRVKMEAKYYFRCKDVR
nr:MAG: capsid protein [Owegonang virus 11]